MPTRRQRIAELLRSGPHTVEVLAGLVRSSPPTVRADLEHVRRGLSAGEVWHVEPASCESCGFVFRERAKASKPSRCPRCRSERIAHPAFEIRGEA